MPYTVYKVTNQLTGDFYIGVHKTDNPMDDYLGSGKVIRQQVALHGPENFTKEVLHNFEARRDAYAKEAELVNPLLGTPGCLNLHPGGHGGFGFINAHGLCDRHAASLLAVQARQHLLATDATYRDRVSSSLAEAGKRSWEAGHNGLIGSRCDWVGRKHSSETKKKMSESHNGCAGEGHSQFGWKWVINPNTGECKKLTAYEADLLLKAGWRPGRTLAIDKVCSTCKCRKPLDAFTTRKKQGRSSYCIECAKQKNRDRKRRKRLTTTDR